MVIKPQCKLLKFLSTDRFPSRNFVLFENLEIISPKEDQLISRGYWNRRREFLLSCIGTIVGFQNALNFAINVYKYGGGTFLIAYFILCLMIGLPLLILEMGIGQFLSFGCTKVFKCVSLLYGVGWGQIGLVSILLLNYGTILSWAYFYLSQSFRSMLPWTSCNHTFNSPFCISNLDVYNCTKNLEYRLSIYPFNCTGSKPLFTSTYEYYYIYALNYQNYSTNSYPMSQSTGSPLLHLSLSLWIVWMMAFGLSIYGIKIIGKIALFNLLFSFVAIIICFSLACSLPGTSHSFLYLMRPNVTKLFYPSVYFAGLQQLISSLSLSTGEMITLASYNNFHDNFIRDAVIVMIVNSISSFFTGSTVFLVIGYMSYRNGMNLDSILTDQPNVLFVALIDAISTLPASNLFTIIFILMIIATITNKHLILLKTFLTGINDTYGKLSKTFHKQILFISMTCGLFFIVNLFLVTPNGLIYHVVLERVVLFGLPSFALLECLVTGPLYGFKNFCRDIQMMTGFQLHNYFFGVMAYISPALISILILSIIINYKLISILGNPVSLWVDILPCLIFFWILTPIIYCSIRVLSTYMKYFRGRTIEAYIKALVNPSLNYGPSLKYNWLYHKEYQIKFLNNLKIEKFNNLVSKREDVKGLSRIAREMRKKDLNHKVSTNYRNLGHELRRASKSTSTEMTHELFTLSML